MSHLFTPPPTCNLIGREVHERSLWDFVRQWTWCRWKQLPITPGATGLSEREHVQFFSNYLFSFESPNKLHEETQMKKKWEPTLTTGQPSHEPSKTLCSQVTQSSHGVDTGRNQQHRQGRLLESRPFQRNRSWPENLQGAQGWAPPGGIERQCIHHRQSAPKCREWHPVMPTHTKPSFPVPMKQVTSHKDFLWTSARFRAAIFHLCFEVVFSPCLEAWKSERAATWSYQSSLWMASSLLAPSPVNTGEINMHQVKKRVYTSKQTASFQPLDQRWTMNHVYAPFANLVTWDALVVLAVLKWGSWDIPSTTETQTAPWGVTGCPACFSQRSTVSPLQWSGQSWHCGQTLERWKNSKMGAYKICISGQTAILHINIYILINLYKYLTDRTQA